MATKNSSFYNLSTEQIKEIKRKELLQRRNKKKLNPLNHRVNLTIDPSVHKSVLENIQRKLGSESERNQQSKQILEEKKRSISVMHEKMKDKKKVSLHEYLN